jgi:carbohydrate-selective porin OprB
VSRNTDDFLGKPPTNGGILRRAEKKFSDELGPIADAVPQPRDETGVELYYKAAVSDWFEITADVQFVEPAVRIDATTAVVAGLRANIEF